MHNPVKPGVLILGCEYQALGLLRQLAREGVPCVLVDEERWGPALFSRYKQQFHKSPRYQSKEFWPWLADLAKSRGYVGWAIIPTHDEQARALAENYDELQCVYRYAGLSWGKYQHVYNKRLAHKLATDLGISTAACFTPDTENRLPQNGQLGLPFIVKPAFKREFAKVSKKKALLVKDNRDLAQLLEGRLRSVPVEQLIYQELIPGDGQKQWSYCGFFVGGEPIAAFTAIRRRQKPPDFGRSSTFVVAEYDQEVEHESLRLLAALKYTGLAEVEWKRSKKDGKLRFLEVNARSWGWHSLAVPVVGNLPMMLYRYLVDGIAEPVQSRYGAKWVKWITDIPVAVHMLSRGDLRLQEYIHSLAGEVVSCDWDRPDPGPFFLQFLLVPYFIATRGY